jgi:hypothetical protein
MRFSNPGDGRRGLAVLAALAFLFVVIGSTGGFAAHPNASGEACVGCAGCDTGECGGDHENPLTSHHHCCTTSCLAHASLALPVAYAAPAPVPVGPTDQGFAVAVIGRAPETPYRPPRI